MNLFKKIISKFPFFYKLVYKLVYSKFYKKPHNGHGTHVPALNKILDFLWCEKKDSLIVLEFGTGLYSTKNISLKLNSFNENITIKNKHMFLSLDHSHEWLKKTEKDFKAIEKFTNHVFIYSGGDSKDNWIKTIKNLSLNLKGSIPDLVFIDSFPWESRTLALNEFKNIGKIIMIHDVDYYPHNNVWGEELDPIKNKPISRWRYGNLKKENLGYRDYSKIFEYWIEFFPFEPGYFTGPPTLIGSNVINVKKNLLENLQKKGICLT